MQIEGDGCKSDDIRPFIRRDNSTAVEMDASIPTTIRRSSIFRRYALFASEESTPLDY